jgi:hypothetical protein
LKWSICSASQRYALLRHLLAEEAVRDLDENACAIAHQRVGTDSTAMSQVLEDEQPVLDDLVRLLPLHMRNEADAAGIVLVARVVKALRGRKTGGCDRRAFLGRFRSFASSGAHFNNLRHRHPPSVRRTRWLFLRNSLQASSSRKGKG